MVPIKTLFMKLERIERLQRRSIRGRTYIMPNGAKYILSYQQANKGFSHAVQHIDDGYESRIVANAISDSDGGRMLALLHAVMHPVDTGD